MFGRSHNRLDSQFFSRWTTVAVLLCQVAVAVSSVAVSGEGEWSGWSACSSSCGQGIASRSRDCAGESITARDARTCRGQSSQVKICLLQDCPRDRPSARELACSHYNSRVFSGKRYSWEPFIHPTDPCKLTCRAKGVHFYANLPARLEDGESCTTGQTKAVCLKGLCQVVGCDDLVASQAVKDKCGVCKGDDSTCKTISGIFTSTELKRGLNFVLSIPSGSTSINITELMTSRNSLILEDSLGQAFINSETKSPTSGDVTAAGVVFSYSARSPTNSRESIVSLGPTNETIILKLLLRDGNPGIIYTFSVPNVIGDTDLRQIIHRSQPVELAPGTGQTLEHQSSLGVKSPWSASSQDDPVVSSTKTTQADVGIDLTTTSSLDSAQKVTPTSVTSIQLTFSHISKVHHSNNKTFLASFEESTLTTQNIDKISETAGNETRNVSSDSGRNTFVNVQDTEQTDVTNDAADTFEGKNPAGGGNSSYLTSEKSSNGNFEVNTSSIKNRSGKQKSLAENGESGGQAQSSDLDRAYLDTPTKDDTTTEGLLAPKIVVVTRHASQYNIPKYSQTFNYNSQPGAQRRQNVRLENSREQESSRPHHSRPDDSLNIQHPQIIEKSSPVRRSEFSGSKQLGPLHFGSLNSGRGDRISAFGTSLNQGGGMQRANPDKLERERARAERQRQLQERQILVEQHRRRIQQQQESYNNRMREYNEKVQRRAQLAASRQQRLNGARNEYRVPERKPSSSQRHEEHRRVNHADNRGSGTVTHETAFHVAITNTGPVVTKVRDQRIETPRDPGESIIRQHTGPEPTNIAFKRGPIFAQPEGLTDDTQDGSEVINKGGDYEINNDLSKKQHGIDHGNNGGNNRPITSGQGFDNKSGPRKESNSIEDVSTTSQFETFNKADQGQGPGVETEIAKPPLPPTGENGGTKDGTFIRIRQSPEPAAPRYIPVASPESSALTGNDIDQSPETISNDLLSTNQISSRYRPPSNEVFPSNILPNQISLTSDQNSRNSAYEWKISGLTQCTQTCGGGAERTLVVCMDILSQAVVTDENCRHLVKPEVLTFTCNTRPCPAVWTPGSWTPCTVTCGQGEQTRVVTCQARVSPTLNWTMPVESCDHLDKLPNRQTCNNNPCSHWRVGNWSSCSAGCGDGQRSRDVDCVDTANNVVSDELCTELKPSSEERCHLGECGKGWLFTDWPEECPAQCGTGRMTRRLFCSDDDGNPLPDNRCDTDQRPADTKSCRTTRPCGGIWFTGQWSECNTTCGLGHKKRDVICIKALSGSVQAVVTDDNCETDTKPVELDQCQGPVCAPQWYMTSWSECSQSCGTGHKTREVKCLDAAQVHSDDCPLNHRPKTRAPCNTQQCGAVTDSRPTNLDLQNPNCEDESAQCSVAQKARMCQYESYRRMCCKSCAAADDS